MSIVLVTLLHLHTFPSVDGFIGHAFYDLTKGYRPNVK